VPIYEFRCPDGHLFEVFQRMDDPPPEVCEICGKGPLTKVLHPVPIHFKGSGFYSTDYGRAARMKEAADGGDTKPADEGAKKKETKDKKEPAAPKSD
jgi:putative FmdB family regulatory protein